MTQVMIRGLVMNYSVLQSSYKNAGEKDSAAEKNGEQGGPTVQS